MGIVVNDRTVLEATPYCVVRKQEDRVVVYNSRTDELHLLPHTGHYVYRLCDGVRDVGTLVREVSRSPLEQDTNARESVLRFLNGLVARGIVRPVADG